MEKVFTSSNFYMQRKRATLESQSVWWSVARIIGIAREENCNSIEGNETNERQTKTERPSVIKKPQGQKKGK